MNKSVYGENNLFRKAKDYDLYDRGYKTGSQVNIFFGPIWVEEAIAITKQSQSGDAPVYGYSDIFYNDLLLGRYLINGTIAIAYTEPNYLLRIMNEIEGISIQDKELYELIERRKSIFQNTVKYRLLTEKFLDAENAEQQASLLSTKYTDRILTEIELARPSGSKRPHRFELTIIRGDIYDDKTDIDIYEDVKIVGEANNIVSDDSAQIELYQFIARKKPEKKIVSDIIKPPVGEFSEENIIDLMLQVAQKLVNRLMEGPSVEVKFPTYRANVLTNANSIGYTGLITSNVRMSGQELSVQEIVWEYEFERYINKATKFPESQDILKIGRTEPPQDNKIISDGTLLYFDNPDVPQYKDTRLKLYSPASHSEHISHGAPDNGFDNSFGKLAYILKEPTSRQIAAVAHVMPIADQYQRTAGTILLPRYNVQDFYAGMMITPMVIPPDEFFLERGKIRNITAASLWWMPLAFRESARKADRDPEWGIEGTDYSVLPYEVEGIYKEDNINAISQPLFSIGVFDTDSFRIEEESVVFTAPYLIDTYLRRSEDRISGNSLYKEQRPKVKIYKDPYGTFQNKVEDTEGFEGIKGDLESTIFRIESVDMRVEPRYGDIDILDKYKPMLFQFEDFWAPATSLISNPNKCFNIRPWAYFYNPPVEVKKVMGSWTADIKTVDDFPSDTYDQWLYIRKQGFKEQSCQGDFLYDWGVDGESWNVDSTFYKFDIIGYFYKEWKESDTIYLTIYENGNLIQRPIVDGILKYKDEDIDVSDLKVGTLGDTPIFNLIELRTFWTATMTAVGVPDREEASEDLRITYQFEESTGRLLQIYNYVRCDVLRIPPVEIYEGISGTVQSLIDRFNRWIAKFFIHDISLEYIPYREQIQRIAAYARGYTYTINAAAIVDQLLKCQFKKAPGAAQEQAQTTADISPEGSEQGYQRAEGRTAEELLKDLESNIPRIQQQLLDVVLNMITNETKIRSIQQIERDNSKVTLQATIHSPIPNVISYSLSEEGFNDMNKGNNFTEEDTEPGASLFGGYSE